MPNILESKNSELNVKNAEKLNLISIESETEWLNILYSNIIEEHSDTTFYSDVDIYKLIGCLDSFNTSNFKFIDISDIQSGKLDQNQILIYLRMVISLKNDLIKLHSYIKNADINVNKLKLHLNKLREVLVSEISK